MPSAPLIEPNPETLLADGRPSLRAAALKDAVPRNEVRIFLVGSEAAGKTCFLGGLQVLSDAHTAPDFFLQCRDISSAQYLNTIAETLDRQEWPAPTHALRLLSLTVYYKNVALTFTLLDGPGETIRNSLNGLEAGESQKVLQHLLAADVILLLLDPGIDLLPNNGDPVLTPEEENVIIHRQRALSSGLASVYQDAREGIGRTNTPGAAAPKRPPATAAVLTKCDLYPYLSSRAECEQFVQHAASGLYEGLKRWTTKLPCFPVSATGGTEDSGPGDAKGRRIPQHHLQPTGYIDLFDWIVKERIKVQRKAHTKRLVKWLGVAAGALCVLLAGYQIKLSSDTQKVANHQSHIEGTGTLQQLNENSNHVNHDIELLKPFMRKHGEILAKLEENLERASSSKDIEILIDELKTLINNSSPEFTKRQNEIRESAGRKFFEFRQNELSSLFELAKGGGENPWKKFQEEAHAYLAQYSPPEPYKTHLHSWLDQITRQEENQLIVEIANLLIKDSNSLSAKATKMREYLNKFPHASEKKDMERAAELADLLASGAPFTVRLRTFGEFKATWLRGPKWVLSFEHTGKNEQKGKKLHAVYGKTRAATWDGEVFQINKWQPKDEITISLEDRAWQNEDIGKLSNAGPISLSLLAGEKKIPIQNDAFKEAFKHSPSITLEIDGISQHDWEVLEKYLAPGYFWVTK